MSQDAWLNAKGISLIRPPGLEKTSKTCWNIGIFCRWPKTAKSDHILEVFLGQCCRNELIPFALSQASWDTSLEYPHGPFWWQQISKYFALCPLFGTWKKYFANKYIFFQLHHRGGILVHKSTNCWQLVSSSLGYRRGALLVSFKITGQTCTMFQNF